ncbi:MAG: nucleotidyltransferase domain-containing protein [Acidobacteria bacterium]|nr:nucleotidyltransferase domain-containing protein [Acidobacteriota bacterium]
MTAGKNSLKAFKSFRIRGHSQQAKEQIQDLCEQIVRVANPQKVILFGSDAYGKPNEDSDVDLLVVMPFADSPQRQASGLRIQIQGKSARLLVCCSLGWRSLVHVEPKRVTA